MDIIRENRNNGFGQKKIIGIMLGTVIILLVVIGSINTPQQRITRQLTLGNKYLEESDYEQARIAFAKVIEIDPSIKEAYFGLAEVYLAQNDYSSAQNILKQGYEVTEDEMFIQKIEEIMILVKEEKIQMFKKDNKEICKSISKAYNEGKYAKACELAKPLLEDAIKLMEKEDVIYIETEEGAVGVYMEFVSMYYWDNPIIYTMLYCGDYEDGIRQGMGLYISLFGYRDSDRLSYAVGEWKEDKPNGYQKVCVERRSLRIEEMGYVLDGIWNSKVVFEEVELEFKHRVEFSFENGKVQIIKFNEEENLYMIGDGESYYENGEWITGGSHYCEEEPSNIVYGMNEFGYGESDIINGF